MDNNTTQPLASFAKAQPGIVGGVSMPQQNQKDSKSNKKKIFAVLGILAFVIVAMVGVLIVQRQREVAGPQAPNAPASKPSAALAPVTSCTLTFDIAAIPSPSIAPKPSPSPTPKITPSPLPNPDIACVGKYAYKDEVGNGKDTNGDGILDYKLLTEQSEFTAGDIAVFAVDIQGAYNGAPVNLPVVVYDQLSGINMTNYATFMDSNCGPNAYDTKTKLLTCNLTQLVGNTKAPEKFGEVVFRVKLKASVPSAVKLTNIANVYKSPVNDTVPGLCKGASCPKQNTCSVVIGLNPGIGGPSPTPTIKPSPSPTPKVSPSPTPKASPSPTPGVTPSPTPRVTPTPTPSPVITYACNSECTSDAQCQTANAAYICDNETNRCRLDSNRSDVSCQPKPNEYTCNSACQTTAQCQTANSGYICDTTSGTCRMGAYPSQSNCLAPAYTPAPPAVGCNEVCSTNADCSNSNHICYTISDGTNRCRLESYPNSDNCAVPPVYTPTEPAPAQPVAQPALPEELPETGAADTVFGWLKAGLVALGIGAVLLLLL